MKAKFILCAIAYVLFLAVRALFGRRITWLVIITSMVAIYITAATLSGAELVSSQCKVLGWSLPWWLVWCYRHLRVKEADSRYE